MQKIKAAIIPRKIRNSALQNSLPFSMEIIEKTGVFTAINSHFGCHKSPE
jgi:hypothetical protein